MQRLIPNYMRERVLLSTIILNNSNIITFNKKITCNVSPTGSYIYCTINGLSFPFNNRLNIVPTKLHLWDHSVPISCNCEKGSYISSEYKY